MQKRTLMRPFLHMSGPVSRVLSRTTICLDLPLPTGSSHLPGTAGPAVCPSTVLLRIEFTASPCLHGTGELLPRLSTLTPPKRGGISLLHLSEGCPWRVLPVILALRSPDFPHVRAFALYPRSLGLLLRFVFYSILRMKSTNFLSFGDRSDIIN